MITISIYELASTSGWLDTVINAIAIVVGAWVIFWQVGKQFHDNRKLQQQNAREKLYLEIYREITNKIDSAYEAELELANIARMLPSDIRLWKSPDFIGMPNGIKNLRAMHIISTHAELSTAVVRVMAILERYEIALPRMKIFREAFNSALHDTQRTSTALFQATLPILPMDVPLEQRAEFGQDVWLRPAPSDAVETNIGQLSNALLEASQELACYLQDCQVEAQILLLSDLFNNQVARRQPIDPRFKVIRADTQEVVDELQAYFENETAWGRAKRQANQDAAAEAGVPQNAAES